jgi:hypothetical protein
MRLYFIILITNVFLCSVSQAESTTNEIQEVRSRNSNDIFQEKYPPVKAQFTRSRNEAVSFGNAKWNALTNSQKAQHIHTLAKELLLRKGYDYLNPWIVVCTSYHESEFIPQWKTTAKSSTASGLMQVTNTTISGLRKQSWFKPLSPEIQRATSTDSTRLNTASSMAAQIELGIETFHLKRVEGRTKSEDTLLRRYRGSGSNSTDRNYSSKIRNCSSCINKSGVSQRCLSMAKRL